MSTMYSELDTLYICWFRRNLRVHDNVLLTESNHSSTFLIPLYIIDPAQVNKELMGANRLGFLLECLHDLDNNLRNKYNQRLFITYGFPLTIIQNIVFHIRGFLKFTGDIVIGMEKDYQPYEKIRDNYVMQWADKEGIRLQYGTTQTLWNLDFLGKINQYKAAESMKQFKEIIGTIDEPCLDQNEPDSLPPPMKELFEKESITSTIKKNFGSINFFDRTPSIEQLKIGYTSEDHTTPFKGGETEALRKINIFLKKIENVTRLNENNDNSTKNSSFSSQQSPYISLGCLSVRKFYYDIKRSERYLKKKSQIKGLKTVENLTNSLIWREFFYMLGYFTQNFDKMYNNAISKLTECWDYNFNYIKAWEQGETGYPAIDAVIQQLIQEGWVNNNNRQFIACFLTKGTLWQSWEIGLSFFQKYLIDFDWAINTGLWIFFSNSNLSEQNQKVPLILRFLTQFSF